jgi:DMSO/TMAO reductase YedYZ heme-binding membrane subunit
MFGFHEVVFLTKSRIERSPFLRTSFHQHDLIFTMIRWDAAGIAVFIFSLAGILTLVVFMLPFLGTRTWRSTHVLLILGHALCLLWSITGVLDGYSSIIIAPNIRYALGLVCIFLILQIHFQVFKLFRVLTTISSHTLPRIQILSGILFVVYLSIVVYTTWNSSRPPWEQVLFD